MESQSRPATQTLLLERIAECIAAREVPEHIALREAGLHPDFLRDIRRRGHSPKAEKLRKLASWLERPVSYLVDAVVAPGEELPARKPPLSARRFRAARWACWGDDVDLASQRLCVTVRQLQLIEAGKTPVSQQLTAHFSEITGVPVVWFTAGSMAGMPGPAAARVGVFDPSLVPGPVSGPFFQTAGRLGRAHGGE